MNSYYYTYVLRSQVDRNFYTGYTSNLVNRLAEHSAGKVESTKNRGPLELVYWEGCLNQQDATKREKYLKTAWGETVYQEPIEKLSHGVNPRRGEIWIASENTS